MFYVCVSASMPPCHLFVSCRCGHHGHDLSTRMSFVRERVSKGQDAW